MEKIIKRVSKLKNDKNCYTGYVRCFTNNKKANELYQQSKTFSSIKTYLKTKKSI